MSLRAVPSAPRRGKISNLALGGFGVLAGCTIGGCTSAPEPPPTPQAVLELSERYDRPTAAMNGATARTIVDDRLPQYAALETLAGLAFLRDVVADGTADPATDADLGFEVQGSLEVHAPCPGWADRATADDTNGFIELVIGVEQSRVQRAFTGRATDCRWMAEVGGNRIAASASMEFELDLGRSFGLGEPIPPLLVRVTDIASDTREVIGALDLEDSDELSLRVGHDDLLETLVEPDGTSTAARGTFVLALRDDGRVGVRGRDGEWVCGSQRSDPCVRVD